MFDYLKKPMPVLVFIFAVLNLLDYLTTVYVLTNVPNSYEMNFELADFDLMYRVKIINANMTIVFFLGIATIFERIKNYDRITKSAYYVQLAMLLFIVGSYIPTVFNNAYICVTHMNPEPLNTFLDLKRRYLGLYYNPDSDYINKAIDWILKFSNFSE